MKFTVIDVRPSQPATDATRTFEPDAREYPEGTRWQVIGEVLDDADEKIGEFNFMATDKADYAPGSIHVLSPE